MGASVVISGTWYNADDTLSFDSAVGASRNESIRQGATTKSVTVDCRATGALERNIVAVLARIIHAWRPI